MRYLADGRGEVQQNVAAQVQAMDVPQLLLDNSIVKETGQRV